MRLTIRDLSCGSSRLRPWLGSILGCGLRGPGDADAFQDHKLRSSFAPARHVDVVALRIVGESASANVGLQFALTDEIAIPRVNHVNGAVCGCGGTTVMTLTTP